VEEPKPKAAASKEPAKNDTPSAGGQMKAPVFADKPKEVVC
jgi:hypothetical protein